MRDGQPYNGESWGVGLRLQTSGAVALQAGLYRNSFDRWSRYATCDWTPFPAFGTNMGVFAAITHNDPYNDGGLMPASGFLARWSGKGSSVIVRLVPPIYEVNGSIAMEIGMRL